LPTNATQSNTALNMQTRINPVLQAVALSPLHFGGVGQGIFQSRNALSDALQETVRPPLQNGACDERGWHVPITTALEGGNPPTFWFTGVVSRTQVPPVPQVSPPPHAVALFWLVQGLPKLSGAFAAAGASNTQMPAPQ
jgi:hypothetical protein